MALRQSMLQPGKPTDIEDNRWAMPQQQLPLWSSCPPIIPILVGAAISSTLLVLFSSSVHSLLHPSLLPVAHAASPSPSLPPLEYIPALFPLLPFERQSHPHLEAHPRLCVVAKTQPAHYRYLPAFLASLTQMDMKLSIFLVVTEENQELPLLEAVVAYANGLAGPGVVQILPITKDDAAQVFPKLGKVDDRGYAYLDASLSYLQNSSTAGCEYFLFTSGENLYSSYFSTNVLPYMQKGMDVIAYDFVSAAGRASMVRNEPGLVDSGRNKCINVEFQFGAIDLGAMVLNAMFLKRTGLRFTSPEDTDLHAADFNLVKRAVGLTENKLRIGQLLFIQQ